MSNHLRIAAWAVPRLATWLQAQRDADRVELTMVNGPGIRNETLQCEAVLPDGRTRTKRIPERRR